MNTRNLASIAAAVLAVALLLGYVLPVAIKLRDPALAIVIAIGLVAMVVDLWQLLHAPED